MTRAAPTDIPEDATQFGAGRYVVFESLGFVSQGDLYALWDTRLRMWRVGLLCDPEDREAIQDTARKAEDIRQPGLLRTRDVLEDWVVLEDVAGAPMEIRTSWPVDAARDAVHSLARAALALRDAGLDPGPLGPEHLLVADDHRLLLIPPACTPVVDTEGAHTAKALSLLLAGLVRGLAMDSSYDDASALPPGLAAAHARATGHRPVLAELVRGLESYDAYAEEATDAKPASDAEHASRSSLIQSTDDGPAPSYLSDGAKVRADRERRLEETRRKAEEAADSARAEAAATKAAEARQGRMVATIIAVLVAVGCLIVMPPAGLLGYGTSTVRGARSASLTAEASLADVLKLEAGALDELDTLGIDPEPIRLAHVAGPIHEGQALARALEQAAAPPLSERPESRILQQRWQRIGPVFAEALSTRGDWKAASDGLAGGIAVSVGLAPPYEPIPSVEHLMDDPIE